LSRYRREWRYARRFRPHFAGCARNAASAHGSSTVEISETLRVCLRKLPEPDRRLIESLYWEAMTEVVVTQMDCLSHQAISKRKRRILEQLTV
jgi:hypothetical protein